MTEAPHFWWRPDPGLQALALSPLSLVWGWRTARRMDRPPRLRPSVPVVCVGNLVVGGAGKTPTALALAEIARSRDLRPGFLSRGYGGSTPGPVVVDPGRHGAADVGDEPLLLAAEAPTVVSANRVAGARLLLAQGIDLIIMDDGFQNPDLAKQLSLVVVDSSVGTGNGFCVPAGPMRAPLKRQLAHANALVLVGEGSAASSIVRSAARAGKPILRARLKPSSSVDWSEQPILAYAGIGRPDKFFDSLTDIGAPVKLALPFPDHHVFTEAEAEDLMSRAKAGSLKLVTTTKDRARLVGRDGALAELREQSTAFPVALEFENEALVASLIADTLRRLSRR